VRAFLLGLAGVALSLVWLSRLKQRDLAASAATLGLAPAAMGAETKVAGQLSTIRAGAFAGVPCEVAAAFSAGVQR